MTTNDNLSEEETMFSVVVTIPFEAAHRINGHEGKCKHFHGHSYQAVLSIQSKDGDLDALGMVVDFGLVKKVVKRWIDQFWDHNAILAHDDPMVRLGILMKDQGIWVDRYAWNEGKEPYTMRVGQPTAENMAKELMDQLQGHWGLPKGLVITKVTIQEGPGSYATYELEPTRS